MGKTDMALPLNVGVQSLRQMGSPFDRRIIESVFIFDQRDVIENLLTICNGRKIAEKNFPELQRDTLSWSQDCRLRNGMSYLRESIEWLGHYWSNYLLVDKEFSRPSFSSIGHFQRNGIAIWRISRRPSGTLYFQKNVGPQIALLAIVNGYPLFASIDGSRGSGGKYKNEQNKFGDFKGAYLLALGGAFGVVGIWICMFVAPRRGFVALILQTILMMTGWLVIVFHDEILSFLRTLPPSGQVPHNRQAVNICSLRVFSPLTQGGIRV